MDSLDLILTRYYTKELENHPEKDVYDLFQWKKVDVLLKDHKTGRVITDMKHLEFPIHYSQNACDIISSKYFRKAGIPNELGYENSMRMVANRMVSFWRDALKDEGLLSTEEQEKIFYDEMVFALLNQMYAPNSPQWFNTGLAQSYGIRGTPSGNFYYDPLNKNVVRCEDYYTRTQASACFILSIEDKLLGNHSISEQYVTETKLFKGGSGCGTNYSTLRAEGEKLSGGGVSSGLMSFLKGFDRNAGAIKSGGTTRRAAKMVCLDIDHPEIIEFISWKAKEEDKVRALIKMGYDSDFNGEAYATVSGQNSNNSIRISNNFMKKVDNLDMDPNTEIELKGRVDPSVNRMVKIRELWDLINESAWKCADPAPQFDDTFNSWHTCPCGEDGIYNAPYNRLNSTNPCGEYAFLDDTSCNLSSINLLKFYDFETKSFDYKGFMHVISLNQLMLEASVHWGQFPTEDIARKTYMFRATGLGVSNLASLLMVMGYPYDSEEGRAIASSLIGLLTGHSYYISSLMAKSVGTFEKFDINRPYMLRVIRNHARVAGALNTPFEDLGYTPISINHALLNAIGFDELSNILRESWINVLENSESFGFRNAQVSVIAPTGTISFAMDSGSTSIEPFFSHVIYKKLVGGGYMTIVNPVIEASLKNLGYKEEEIKHIVNYVLRTEKTNINGVEHERLADGKLEGAPYLKEEHYPIFDTANKSGTGIRFISPEGHVKMVAAITPLISGAISKTVNLPKTSKVEDFKHIILMSWKLGVKGITLYRDSSKASQPLNTSMLEEGSFRLEDLNYYDLLEKAKEYKKSLGNVTRRTKPEGIRYGTTHPAQIGDVKIYTTVNRNEKGEICEIYITTDREGTIITGLLNSLSKSISVMLQHHVPPQDISSMLRGQMYEPYGFVQRHPYIKNVTSISDLISKIIDIELGDFSTCQVKPEKLSQSSCTTPLPTDEKPESIKGERVYGSVCPNCSSIRMVRNGTCMVCLDCGSTTGCS